MQAGSLWALSVRGFPCLPLMVGRHDGFPAFIQQHCDTLDGWIRGTSSPKVQAVPGACPGLFLHGKNQCESWVSRTSMGPRQAWLPSVHGVSCAVQFPKRLLGFTQRQGHGQSLMGWAFTPGARIRQPAPAAGGAICCFMLATAISLT